MNDWHFSDAPRERYRAQREPGGDRVRVDDAAVAVQADGPGRFVARLDGRSERLHALAHGDRVWVHWRGRDWQLQRIAPTRGSGPGGAEAAGSGQAPMRAWWCRCRSPSARAW